MSKFHVLCKLPFASDLISGVKFIAHEIEDGVKRTAEAVEKETAELFAGIPGYEIVDAEEKPAKPVAAKAEGTEPKRQTRARSSNAAAKDKAPTGDLLTDGAGGSGEGSGEGDGDGDEKDETENADNPADEKSDDVADETPPSKDDEKSDASV